MPAPRSRTQEQWRKMESVALEVAATLQDSVQRNDFSAGLRDAALHQARVLPASDSPFRGSQSWVQQTQLVETAAERASQGA